MDADDKISLNGQIVDIKGAVSTKIFSEKTVEVIGKGIMNIYGGLLTLLTEPPKANHQDLWWSSIY